MPELLERWDREIRELIGLAVARDVSIAPEAAGKLLEFCREIYASAAAVDLVSRGDRAQLPAKHVAASLGALLVEQPQAGSRWIDVGTGGGF
ncbi:MAG: hypothetical protein V1774_07830, partial [Candidatus Eisenbacteria bacterium]